MFVQHRYLVVYIGINQMKHVAHAGQRRSITKVSQLLLVQKNSMYLVKLQPSKLGLFFGVNVVCHLPRYPYIGITYCEHVLKV